jgi:hypothetical protein
MVCLTSCKTKDGTLDDVSTVLMTDPELNVFFSSITVEISNGKLFDAILVFKDTTSQMVSELSPEEGCALAELVHDKIKAAVLDAGYTQIRWIEAMMYSSDWKDIENDYVLSFSVGAANKTHVKVWTNPSNPIWDEVVSWGGFDEVT